MIKYLQLIKFLYLRPEYLNISISLFSNKFIKNNWIVRSKMKGDISNIIEGEFIKDNKSVNSSVTLVSLKNSISVKIFKINTRLSITLNT